MKTKIFTKFLCSALVAAAVLVVSQTARALAFDDTLVLGTVTPASPFDDLNSSSYINFLITLAPGGSGTFSGQTITRSTNLFGSLPAALPVGVISGTGTSINLDTVSFTYLFAKYDEQNDISFVWQIADLSGLITIPAVGPLGHGLTEWKLFNPSVSENGNGNGVPESGSTIVLMLGAVATLTALRQKLGVRS